MLYSKNPWAKLNWALLRTYFLACFFVHSLAVLLKAALLSLNCLATSSSRGESVIVRKAEGHDRTKVRLTQHLANKKKDLRDLYLRAPLGTQYLRANLTVCARVSVFSVTSSNLFVGCWDGKFLF